MNTDECKVELIGHQPAEKFRSPSFWLLGSCLAVAAMFLVYWIWEVDLGTPVALGNNEVYYADEAEFSDSQRLMRSLARVGYIEDDGLLKLRIVAESGRHQTQLDLAHANAESDDEAARLSADVKNAEGDIVARWVPIAREESSSKNSSNAQTAAFNFSPTPNQLARLSSSGEIVCLTEIERKDDKKYGAELAMWCDAQGGGDVEVLVVEPEFGRSIVRADFTFVKSKVVRQQNAVEFWLTSRGDANLRQLSRENLGCGLAVVIDEELHSAYEINGMVRDRLRIVGGFTKECVEEFVEHFGTRESPISNSQIKRVSGKCVISLLNPKIKQEMIAIIKQRLVDDGFRPFTLKICDRRLHVLQSIDVKSE